MKLFKNLAPVLGLGALLIGCGADLTETSNNDAQVKGSVLFVTSDYTTGNTMDSVSVLLVKDGSDKASFTDSAGQVIFKSLDNGDYLFEISKSGYATMWIDVGLGIENNDSDAPRIYDLVERISLYELGSEVTGKVYYTDENGDKQVAEDADVELTVSSMFKKKLYTTTTDENGSYTFSDLPENVTYTIKVKNFTDADGVMHTLGAFSVGGVKVGESEKLPNKTMSVNANSFEVLRTNGDGLAETDTFKVRFSEAVNTGLIELGDLKVTLGQEVAVEFSWSSDKTLLNIVPVSGKWAKGSTHNFSWDLTSADGYSASGSINFSTTVVGSIADVVGLDYVGSDTTEVNADAITVTIFWNKVANTTSYEVYVKDYTDSSFVYLKSASGSKDTISTSLTVNGLLDEGNSVQVMVVGVNSDNRGSFKTADILTIKDNMDAEVMSESIPTDFVPFDNSGNPADSIAYTVIFDDSMDEDSAPTLSVSSSLTNFMGAGYEWISSTQLRIYAITKGVDASAATGSISIDLSTVTDEAGNKVAATDDNYTIAVSP